MIWKAYRELIILLLVFIAGWTVFTWVRWIPDSPDISVSVETEQKIGELLANEILRTSTLVKNDTVLQAIDLMKRRLSNAIGSTNYDYQFHVIQKEDINAFATLGGHIFIFTGLIQEAERPEEVAAVLAHELGHVEKRHVVHKIVKEMGISVVFSILTGSDPILVGEIAKATISSSFDRSQENEADQFALTLMEQSQMSPRHIASIFRRIKEKYGSYNDHLEFLMSHPNLNKRIKQALEYELSSQFQEVPLDLDWAAVHRNLK